MKKLSRNVKMLTKDGAQATWTVARDNSVMRNIRIFYLLITAQSVIIMMEDAIVREPKSQLMEENSRKDTS